MSTFLVEEALRDDPNNGCEGDWVIGILTKFMSNLFVHLLCIIEIIWKFLEFLVKKARYEPPKSISPGAPRPLMSSTSKVLPEYVPRRPVDLSHTSASSGYTDTEALTYADLTAGPAPSDSEVNFHVILISF